MSNCKQTNYRTQMKQTNSHKTQTVETYSRKDHPNRSVAMKNQ